MKDARIALCVVAGMLATANLNADPLGEAQNLLCTVLDTHVCVENDGCTDLLAEDLNLPRFIKIDLPAKKLSTTEASGEPRETRVDSVIRTEEQITLQGVEAGRAFSMFISQPTGLATFATAAEGRSVSVFGVCTPLPVK